MKATLRKWFPWFALLVFLLLPLYLVSIAFGIRSGMLDLTKKEISSAEYRAFWAFVASGLATAATLIGLLFTKTHNDRTSDQLALDTAVKGLDLLTTDSGAYAQRATIAGALASLVHLGHPTIAMRTLDAVWEERNVDSATACWLISEVILRGPEESKLEACNLLLKHADKLARETKAGRVTHVWPPALSQQWPTRIPRIARLRCLSAIAQVLLSRPIGEWKTYGWALALLDEARRVDQDAVVRNGAALLLEPLLVPYETINNRMFPWQTRSKELRYIRDGLSKHRHEIASPIDLEDTARRLKEWTKAPDGKLYHVTTYHL
jgi:hypothetical protein